jgi:hypothetical protein
LKIESGEHVLSQREKWDSIFAMISPVKYCQTQVKTTVIDFHRRKAHKVMACARLSITGKGLESNYL